MTTIQRTTFAILAALSITVTSSSCGKGSNKNPVIDGIDGPHVSFLDNKFLMTVVFKNINFDQGVRLPFRDLPNSYLEIGPDFQSNGLLLTAGIDANDLRAITGNAFDVFDPLTLPGGRPLPGVDAGYLPGLAITVPRLRNVSFYFGRNVFGAFVPVDLPLDDAIISHRFYDSSGQRIGNISVVGKDLKNENSGFLVLIDIKGRVQTLMDSARN